MERLSDYDYNLPDELIAQEPLADRAASRLLHLDKASGQVSHRMFRDSVDLLQPGDLLVMNNTRVSAVRLFGQKSSGGAAEFLLLRETENGVFEALCKPGKRLQPGTRVTINDQLSLEILENLEEPLKSVRVITDTPNHNDLLRKFGTVPLPPYITHILDDAERYQTVYGSSPGSSAAPTAGLHFTREILQEIRGKGIETAEVTLHVGIDTFRPVMVDDLSLHQMHGEECEVPFDTADKIAACTGRIIAVGTTTVRTLETLAVGPRSVRPGRTVSKLFITPGFSYQIVDGMFTNFHLPRTTMLMMISALASRDSILHAYQQAVEARYRFLSFGDSMLIV